MENNKNMLLTVSLGNCDTKAAEQKKEKKGRGKILGDRKEVEKEEERKMNIHSKEDLGLERKGSATRKHELYFPTHCCFCFVEHEYIKYSHRKPWC